MSRPASWRASIRWCRHGWRRSPIRSGVAVLLAAGGGVAASAFAVLHGSGNGILTIARGTVPLAIFGPENYGYRLGHPRHAGALPLGRGAARLLAADRSLGGSVLLVSAALSLSRLRRPVSCCVPTARWRPHAD